MVKQKVKVGQEVKNRCPFCNKKGVRFNLLTLAKLRTSKKIEGWCDSCVGKFWFYPRTGKVTVKKIDKTYVD